MTKIDEILDQKSWKMDEIIGDASVESHLAVANGTNEDFSSLGFFSTGINAELLKK